MNQTEAAIANGTKTLPDGWRWVRLGEVCEIIAGQSPPSESYRYSPDGLPFFQGKADFGQRHPAARVWCIAPTKIAQAGDILISVRAPVGPTNVADVVCCIGRGLAAIRCGSQTNRDFILAVLKLHESRLAELGSGSTFEAIKRDDLESFEIVLPPFSEQQRIAAILNEQLASVERARSATEAQLEAAKALPAAYLRSVFDSPETKQWPRKKLGDVCEIVMGQSPDGTSYNAGGRGEPLLNGPTEFGVRHPTAVQWTTSPTRHAEAGDILLCVRGATTGRKNIADKRYCIGRGLAAIRGKGSTAITDFLWFSLDVVTAKILSESSGSTFPNIPGEKLERIEISLPSFNDQQRIAAQLSAQMVSMERLRQTLAEQLQTVDQLPAAILYRAFSGQL